MIITREVIAFAEEQLLPLAEEGRKAKFLFVPVENLSHEALFGLIGWLGREKVKREERTEKRNEMWSDMLKAATRK
jgi:hypothetical protein